MADQKFKSKIKAQGGLNLPAQTPETVPVINANGDVVSSEVSSTELSHLEGVTSPIQEQLDNKLESSDLEQIELDISNLKDDVGDLQTLSGVAAGSVDLGSFTEGIIPANSDIKEAIQALEVEIALLPQPFFYAGAYDPSTNTPDLDEASLRVSGAVYYVSHDGSHDFVSFGGEVTFTAGDKVAFNGATWDKWDHTDQVSSVFGRTGAITTQSGDYSADQISLDSEKLSSVEVQAALEELKDEIDGLPEAFVTGVSNTSSVELIVTGGELTANVLPAGVDHDTLQNFVSAEHIDHSNVSIIAGAGLTGGGDITENRTLSVDIAGQTELSEVPASEDAFIVYDSSASALKKVSYQNILAGVPKGSAGDIDESSVSVANNQTTPQNISGFSFNNLIVRSFKALVSVEINSALQLFETFELIGVNKGGIFEMAISSVGDESGIVFTVTSSGQIQYTSAEYAEFVEGNIKFRAITTSV